MWVALGELLGKLLPQLPSRDRNYRTQDAYELLVAVVPEQLQELRHWLGGARQRVAQCLADQPVGASALAPPLELILLQLRDRSWLPRHAHHSSTLGTPIPTVIARRAAVYICKLVGVGGRLGAPRRVPSGRMNLPPPPRHHMAASGLQEPGLLQRQTPHCGASRAADLSLGLGMHRHGGGSAWPASPAS